jgi:cytochrome c2
MSRAVVVIGLVAALVRASAALAQPPVGDVARGQALFQDRCSQCHVLGGQGMGPDLTGVVGRKAGSAPNFSYTPALTASGLTWTPASLDRFLTDPRALVPGTAMRVKLIDPARRADVIAYLASLSRR